MNDEVQEKLLGFEDIDDTRHGFPWYSEEISQLRILYKEKKLSLLEICKIHKRTAYGILSSLKKNKIVDINDIEFINFSKQYRQSRPPRKRPPRKRNMNNIMDIVSRIEDKIDRIEYNKTTTSIEPDRENYAELHLDQSEIIKKLEMKNEELKNELEKLKKPTKFKITKSNKIYQVVDTNILFEGKKIGYII
jgi:hypothetical protein